MVVPPETEPARAARLMGAASDVRNTQIGGALLNDADLRHHRQQATVGVRLIVSGLRCGRNRYQLVEKW